MTDRTGAAGASSASLGAASSLDHDPSHPSRRDRPCGDDLRDRCGRAQRGARRPRRAMIYFAVLSLAMVTGAMAVGALIRARGEFRVSQLGGDSASARDLAASGINYAIGVMNADRAWRSTKPAAATSAPPSLIR
jgi:hypothetical protein